MSFYLDIGDGLTETLTMQLLQAEMLKRVLWVSDFDGNVQRLPGGHTTDWRTLPFFMFSQATDGGERVFLSDTVSHTARAGELIVLPAGVRHKVDVAGKSEVRSWIHVNYFLFNNLDLFSLFDVPVLIRGETGIRIGEVIREWLSADSENEGNQLYRIALRNATGFKLLALLAPLCEPKPDSLATMERMQVFSSVIRHMNEHFNQPVNRDSLAVIAGLSPAQFHNTFRRATGATPIAYLKGIRLRHAQQLLITSGMPIKEIAQRCGYDDQFTFSKFFKRECALSPAIYRRKVNLWKS